jgi:hypothetical protein
MKYNAHIAFFAAFALTLVGCMQKEVVNLRSKQKLSTSDRIKIIEQQIKDDPEVLSEDVAYLDTLKVIADIEMSEDLGEVMDEDVAEIVPTDDSIIIEDASVMPESVEIDPASSSEEVQ